ncbi:calcineurin-like phosphoesterase C-terminal domain-containing protein [Pseudoxanthomonas suwonensis]|uniref:calcineurin-like phosphoesterase C-terminal domain-containing protein n=1 Tax=Pseudoxanthomonas suwonensis TaxID=314722 RepID=UPI00138EF138|nr:calcineurin-like phosphoesterase family protein [Pseudoxanthomonas suwonensis]KAF1700631.1 calcineurin phosphoesterase [Pseudoxanthomonas suwonensis]
MSRRSAAWLLACISALACASVQAQATVEVTGVVYQEQDGRPGRGSGEPGLAGVLVSDGEQLVRTDQDGQYRLQARAGSAVFVVKPAGHRFIPAADGLPAFWARVPGNGRRFAADFALPPGTGADGRFGALVFTDPQVKNGRDIEHSRRAVVEPLGRPGAALGVTLGDLVDDRTDLYPALNAVTTQLGVPWFHVPGNHDLDEGATSDAGSLRAWSRTFGPDTYAVEEGAAAFVLLDDVVVTPGEGAGYTGGLREDQFRFIERYVAQLPRDRLLVLGLHIPLFDRGRGAFRAADRERLFALLKDHPRVLVLSGHSHNQQHYWHGAADGWHGTTPLHEYNVGAICGAFWSGVPDARGIPEGTMSDGTPIGHALLTVERDGTYALAYRPARADGSDPAFTTAMALHAPKVLRRGAYPAWGVFANVFMGDADTRVEYRIDGGPWKPMRRVERADPRLLVENVADDLAPSLRGYDRSPEATASGHLWRGALDTRLEAGTHRVEVRAFDRWQGEVVAATSYALEDAQP